MSKNGSESPKMGPDWGSLVCIRLGDVERYVEEWFSTAPWSPAVGLRKDDGGNEVLQLEVPDEVNEWGLEHRPEPVYISVVVDGCVPLLYVTLACRTADEVWF